MARVLVVEDVRSQALFLRRLIEVEGHEVVTVSDARSALEALEGEAFDVVLTDLRLNREEEGSPDGIALFRLAQDMLGSETPSFVILTAHGTVETAREALRAGVYDFLTKPVDPTELAALIRNAAELRRLHEEHRALTQAVAVQRVREKLIGSSTAFQRVLELARAAAGSEATILVRGESGTGKELLAELIHAASRRADGPFVKVNCGAIPENLLEAELFGHEEGAFTSAHQSRKGRFEVASGGTIFLDEIAEMSPALQVKLLRVLQERELERLGGQGETIPLDLRLVAATNRDLEGMVREGTFREDLYYRVNVIALQAPPLRERHGDVELLANHFCARFTEKNRKQFRQISPEALQLLRGYPWPGNVRELENVIERAVVLGRGEVIEPAHLPATVRERKQVGAEEVLGSAIDHVLDEALPLEAFLSQVIEGALRRHGGNVSRTASALGMTRRALQYRMNRDGIRPTS
jgi:DNA-binding NtrC family response regulator